MSQIPIPFIVSATGVSAPRAEAAIGFGFGGPQRRILNVQYISQTVSNWCWATCATMLSRFVLGSSLKICAAASKLIPSGGCCSGAPDEGTFDRSWDKGSCNRTCTVDEVQQLHGILGMSSVHIIGSVSFADLQHEIAASGRPVEVAYSWTGGGGHVAIVQGIDASTRTIYVHDPWPDYGQTVVPYENLLTAYGKGTWFHTWIGITNANIASTNTNTVGV